MRPEGTAAELERRRRRAVALLEQGERPGVVARILGVRATSLHRWRRMARQADGLAAKPPCGAKRRLGDAQLGELEQLLRQGAPAHGFANELWTAARVAQLIQRHFGLYFPRKSPTITTIAGSGEQWGGPGAVSYTHLRAQRH